MAQAPAQTLTVFVSAVVPLALEFVVDMHEGRCKHFAWPTPVSGEVQAHMLASALTSVDGVLPTLNLAAYKALEELEITVMRF